MRLLFISLDFPLPANNGHKMRTWALLQALAAEGHGIVLLTFGKPRERNGNYELLNKVCQEVQVVPLELNNLTAATDYFGRFRGLLSAQPYAARRFFSPAMCERICFQLRSRGFGAVVLDTVYSAVNLPPIELPLVLNNVDIEHLILERYLRFERNPAKRFYARLEARKVRDWERSVCQRATVGMACSEHDRRVLQSLCNKLPTLVVPNVVDTDAYRPQGEGENLMVVYQGGMDWFPNCDAVNHFVGEVMPKLRPQVPGIRFVVAGRNPSDVFRRRYSDQPDVEFTGTVSDMRPVIARAAVCVVPLRIGSGTRLKILEAAAMAKPIVSTRIGAEGLDFLEGEEIILADEPSQFARAVANLLADPARRRAMGLAARQRVEMQYSLPALRTALRQAFAQLAAKCSTVSHRPEFNPAGAEVRP